MARKPKPVSANDDRLKLIEALKFAAIASKDAEGAHAFVTIQNNWLIAENDTLTVGTPVDVALDLSPHGEQFLAALAQCGSQFQLTQVDTKAVSIKSGNFRALVPAIDTVKTILTPDHPCAVINDALAEAFRSCMGFTGKGERIINTCVALRANTMVATNGGMLIEYWHGIDLPGTLNIPKKTVETIIKIGKPLAHFGFSAATVTFYFDDGSFVITRLVAGEYPNSDRLFNAVRGNLTIIWPEFFAALKAISAFIQDDSVYFHDNFIASHQSLDLGANYRVDGLPGGHRFSAVYWRTIEPFVKTVCFEAPGKPVAFSGDRARGLLMGKIS